MTRISSLLVASTLAILPISAFAQQTAAPAKTAEPAPVTTATTAPITGRTGVTMTTVNPGVKTTTAATATPDVKTSATGAKTEAQGMNATTTHSKTTAPAKPAEPAKS